ncbi:MAG: hypothetical protein AAGI11_17600 [Pseudomonadota bacterium]
MIKDRYYSVECSVPGCTRKVRRDRRRRFVRSALCNKHQSHRYRHGHPTKKRLKVKEELLPFRRRVELLLRQGDEEMLGALSAFRWALVPIFGHYGKRPRYIRSTHDYGLKACMRNVAWAVTESMLEQCYDFEQAFSDVMGIAAICHNRPHRFGDSTEFYHAELGRVVWRASDCQARYLELPRFGWGDRCNSGEPAKVDPIPLRARTHVGKQLAEALLWKPELRKTALSLAEWDKHRRHLQHEREHLRDNNHQEIS